MSITKAEVGQTHIEIKSAVPTAIYMEALQYRQDLLGYPLPITTRENTSYLYTLFRKSQ